MLLRQKLCIAYNHPLRFAELPRGCAGIDHSVALTINPRTIMVERRDVGKRRSRHSTMGALTVPPILLIVADEVMSRCLETRNRRSYNRPRRRDP